MPKTIIGCYAHQLTYMKQNSTARHYLQKALKREADGDTIHNNTMLTAIELMVEEIDRLKRNEQEVCYDHS